MLQLAKTHPRYPKYKPTNIDWIGDIPDGWEAMKLRFIGQFSSSGIDKKLDDNEPTVRMVNYTDVYGNKERKLTASREYMITTTSEEKKLAHQVSVGDLIFTPSSETIEDIGVSALIEEDLPETVFSYHVSRFSFSQPIFHAFKKYLCNNTATYAQFSSKATGTTRKTLAREDFNSTLVVIPGTLEEQGEIAVYLDEKTALIDEAIAKKKHQIELLSEHRTALINNAITKGLEPNAEMKNSGIEWIGMIPKGWEVKKLKYVADINLSSLPENTNPDYVLKYIDISNVGISGIISAPEEMPFQNAPSRARRIVRRNDTIISTVRTYLKALAFLEIPDNNLIVSTGFAVLTPKEEKVCPKYLYFSVLAEYFISKVEAQSTGVSYPAINASEIGVMSIVLPTITEQKRIIEHLEKEITYIEAMKEKIQHSIDLLQEYKTSLISHVVSGKIKVS